MRAPSAWRFFAAVDVHPPYALAILAVVVSIGIWTTTLSPNELDSGLGMVLFVQMFLASSGFLVRARRGHFDWLLTRGRRRTGVVACHWLVSVGPGLVAWLCLAGAGWVLGSPATQSALVGGRAAALFIVSALGWTLGFLLPRGAAGVIWIAALLGLLVRGTDLLAPSGLASPSQVALRHAATLLVCPFLLIGNRILVEPGAVWAASLLSAVMLLAAWRQCDVLDIYLEDRA